MAAFGGRAAVLFPVAVLHARRDAAGAAASVASWETTGGVGGSGGDGGGGGGGNFSRSGNAGSGRLGGIRCGGELADGEPTSLVGIFVDVWGHAWRAVAAPFLGGDGGVGGGDAEGDGDRDAVGSDGGCGCEGNGGSGSDTAHGAAMAPPPAAGGACVPSLPSAAAGGRPGSPGWLHALGGDSAEIGRAHV